MTGEEHTDGLGSLAQAARSKQLNSARNILIIVGLLTVAVNGIFVFLAEKMVDEQFKKEMNQLRQQGMVFDQGRVAELKAEAVTSTRVVNGVGLALGVVFIFLGLNVKNFPVPMTITGLVLYIGAAAVFGMMDPTTLLQGVIIKVLIVVGLFKAVKAAIAYENEMKIEAGPPPLAGTAQ